MKYPVKINPNASFEDVKEQAEVLAYFLTLLMIKDPKRELVIPNLIDQSFSQFSISFDSYHNNFIPGGSTVLKLEEDTSLLEFLKIEGKIEQEKTV